MKQGSAGGNQNDFLRRFFCSNCIAFLWRSCKLRIELQKEAAALAELNLTSAVPHTDCGTERQRGRIGWLIAAGIPAAALLGLLVLTLADLRRAASPIVFPVEDGVYNLDRRSAGDNAGGRGQLCALHEQHEARRYDRLRCGAAGPSRWWTPRPGTVSDMPRSAGAPRRASSPRSAARRYRVSCEGFSPDAVVTISDARTVSFWHSLRAVLGELLSLLAGG